MKQQEGISDAIPTALNTSAGQKNPAGYGLQSNSRQPHGIWQIQTAATEYEDITEDRREKHMITDPAVRRFTDGLYYIGAYNRFIGAWQRLSLTGYASKEEAEYVIKSKDHKTERAGNQ